MNIDGDMLLARLQADWPTEFELSRYRLLTELQAQRITELEAAAATATGFTAGSAAPVYGMFDPPQEGGRHE